MRFDGGGRGNWTELDEEETGATLNKMHTTTSFLLMSV
jgi:hypothetical protein